jgi:hypothetical protein
MENLKTDAKVLHMINMTMPVWDLIYYVVVLHQFFECDPSLILFAEVTMQRWTHNCAVFRRLILERLRYCASMLSN